MLYLLNLIRFLPFSFPDPSSPHLKSFMVVHPKIKFPICHQTIRLKKKKVPKSKANQPLDFQVKTPVVSIFQHCQRC